ncbi:MAG: hypothetical protein ACR2P5_06035 [Gammaproteobacteria bacterium]
MKAKLVTRDGAVLDVTIPPPPPLVITYPVLGVLELFDLKKPEPLVFEPAVRDDQVLYEQRQYLGGEFDEDPDL